MEVCGPLHAPAALTPRKDITIVRALKPKKLRCPGNIASWEEKEKCGQNMNY
jgi:hypothetical protein